MSLTVRQNGSLVENSFVCSQCVWATGRYLRAGQLGDVFSDFTADEEQWKERFREVVVRNRIRTGGDTTVSTSTHLLDKEDLWDLVTAAVHLAGVEGKLTLGGEGLGLWISSRQIPLRDEQPDPEQSSDFLNSFFSRDLHELSKRGLGPESVRRYLGSGPARERIDVGENPGVVYDSVAPDLIPDGRWPADPTQALSVSQQFAVNRIIADVADSSDGLFAVNGPPDTGKTTMLRDIVAALVTRRAQALAEFARPSDAFTKTEYSWISKTDKRRSVRQLRHSVRGAEIIIASSNNGAVDNISLEIPGEKAVFEGYRDVSDYFTDIATALLRSGREPHGGTETGGSGDAENTAWGLVSGRLGSASNRSAFANTLMFGARQAGKGAEKTIGLSDYLGASPRQDVMPWGTARVAFFVARDRVDRLRVERQGLHLAHRERPGLVASIAADRSQLDRLERQLSAAENSAALCRLTVSATAVDEQKARTDVAAHSAAKPNALEVVFTLGRSVKTWRAAQEELTAKLMAMSGA
ncbi:hypothetical protein B7R22_01565 [Subtercola boreus]|uniref:Uncharacterized protein n=2 Tax=Subtercola boreus TaxID=120213 RepID=A0A3E0W5F2_9MICO|nr:hypothetical protein B7R22_01565 [Subtercola boreus]